MGSIIELDKEYIANTYNRFPIELSYGEGEYLYSKDGKRFVDMGTGIGVNAFGISDGEWVRAVTEQLNTLQHTSNLYYTEPMARLAEELCQRCAMKKVFFSNSGAEANECAIKVARKYSFDKYGAGRHTVITLKNSFHGRTLTTLAATGQDKFHELFTPLTDGFCYAEANNLESVRAAIDGCGACAVLIECVQGEGGVIALDADFIKGVEALCRERDLLFMVDEVQTGNGRCGTLYAYMNFGVKPDVITTAKGLGGGLPIGACIMGERCESVLGFGDHGSTFGGNPVCAAGALSIIKRLDDDFLLEVRRKSEYVFSRLSGADGVVGVSGLGLMIGIKTEKPAKEIVEKCIEGGVLCLLAKDKVRLLPPLNISWDALEYAIKVIKDALVA